VAYGSASIVPGENWRTGIPQVAVVRDQRGQRIDQAKAFVGTRQQQDAAIGTDLAGIEGGGDLLLANTLKGKGQKRIVVVRGHGGFCPGVESGVSTQSLRDSRQLYHAASESLPCAESGGLMHRRRKMIGITHKSSGWPL